MMASTESSEDQDIAYMRLALAQAQAAYRVKEVPVGAVLIHDGAIAATGFNQREKLQDPTAHAEIVAIRSAATQLRSWRLSPCTLYVTLEPCAMCIGAIIQSRINRLVFGTRDPKAGACGSICDLTAETRFNHRVNVQEGILAEDCRDLLQQFFQELREVQPVPS